MTKNVNDDERGRSYVGTLRFLRLIYLSYGRDNKNKEMFDTIAEYLEMLDKLTAFHKLHMKILSNERRHKKLKDQIRNLVSMLDVMAKKHSESAVKKIFAHFQTTVQNYRITYDRKK